MILNDIQGMKEYLAEKCYCPGEIYDLSETFARVYTGNEECSIVLDNSIDTDFDFSIVECGDQFIFIFIENGEIIDTNRVNTTDESRLEISNYINHEKEKMKLRKRPNNLFLFFYIFAGVRVLNCL